MNNNLEFDPDDDFTFYIFVSEATAGVGGLSIIEGAAGLSTIDFEVFVNSATSFLDVTANFTVTDCGRGWYRFEGDDTVRVICDMGAGDSFPTRGQLSVDYLEGEA